MATYAHQMPFRLTDETIRENWEKYGHPDGRQEVTTGLALPPWVANNIWVLAAYGLIFGGALPAIVVSISYHALVRVGLGPFYRAGGGSEIGRRRRMASTLVALPHSLNRFQKNLASTTSRLLLARLSRTSTLLKLARPRMSLTNLSRKLRRNLRPSGTSSLGWRSLFLANMIPGGELSSCCMCTSSVCLCRMRGYKRVCLYSFAQLESH